MEMKVRKHIYFSGDVQDVGFRYTSCRIAQSMGLTGWVENRWDGRVEMEVQGTEAEIESLLEQIQNERWIKVRNIEMEELPCVEERGFHIH